MLSGIVIEHRCNALFYCPEQGMKLLGMLLTRSTGQHSKLKWADPTCRNLVCLLASTFGYAAWRAAERLHN